MIRLIAIWLLISTVANAQYLVEQDPIPTSKTPAEGETWGERIGEGAAKSVADLEERIRTLEQLAPPYIPTWTWPGHDGPEAFDRLRAHMAGEVIHPARNVAKWSRAELAFIHDCDHVDEYLAKGKALPLLKDQRLRDWLRAKSPAKALPKKLGWSVKRIVMHTQANCPPCWQWKVNNIGALRADGVEYAEGNADGRSTPWFEVQYCNEDQCINKQFGNVSYATMKQQANSLSL